MVTIPDTPEQRAAADAAMPNIFDDGYHPDRIDWYTRLCVEHGGIRGGVDVIPELVAAMILESGLRNRRFGDSNTASPHFGVGWMQHDTQFYARPLETLIEIRSDPLFALSYTLTQPDLTYQGGRRTHFNRERWHAWQAEMIDPVGDVWSPLGAAHDAWDRVTG